jgi:hypothetical protein
MLPLGLGFVVAHALSVNFAIYIAREKMCENVCEFEWDFDESFGISLDMNHYNFFIIQ